MFGSTKSLLTWIDGVLVAAVIAILSLIFAMEVYIALQDPAEPVPGRLKIAAENPSARIAAGD